MRKLILTFLVFILFYKNSFAFSFRKTIKNSIDLSYKNKYVDSNFIADNFYTKNSHYFICGNLRYILFEKIAEVSNKKCISTIEYCSTFDFVINIENKNYNLYIDSIASIIKPWQNFNKKMFNLENNYKVCFNIDKTDFNIKNLNQYKIKLKFE